MIIQGRDFGHIYIVLVYLNLMQKRSRLTLIRPHNHHRTFAGLNTVFLIRVSVPGVVVFVVDVCFMQICITNQPSLLSNKLG